MHVTISAPEDTVAWQVTAEPVLRIGTEGGDAAYQFHDIRGAVRLPDGAIVVADGSSRELRLFDCAGRFLASAGRRGGGPGEFESIGLLGRTNADTLLVVDHSLRRVSLFLADGSFMTSANLAHDLPPHLQALGQLGSTSVVIGERPSRRFPTAPGSHVMRDSLDVLSVGLDGEMQVAFGEFLGPETYLRASPGSNRAAPLAFGMETLFAFGTDRLFATAEDGRVIQAFSPTGDLAEVYRLERPLIPVRRDDLDLLIEELTDRYGRGRASEIAPLYGEMPVPDHFPGVGGLVVDRQGYLWVQDYPRPGVQRVRWTVLSTQGQVLAGTDLPRDLRVSEIGEDYILGIQRDEFGVENVVLFGLTRAVMEVD